MDLASKCLTNIPIAQKYDPFLDELASSSDRCSRNQMGVSALAFSDSFATVSAAGQVELYDLAVSTAVKRWQQMASCLERKLALATDVSLWVLIRLDRRMSSAWKYNGDPVFQ